MATTISLVPVARWRVTGYSDGPQGADGVPVLAREAYNDMLAAQWQQDDALPQMPVHDYDRTAPRGQAYKCVYGYDADARTERSSCGAECYTYRIPADALNAGNEDGVATIGSVAVRIAADRYLAQGCCIWAELSPSATPSPVAVAIGSGIGPYLIADNQTAPDGSEIAPNKRAAMQDYIALDLADAASAQYLHIHLYLADYLGTRGSWIEGSAMFEAEVLDVAFSRDVAADAPGAGLDAVALDVGRITIGTGTNEVTAAYALQHLPRAALAINFGLTGDSAALTAELDTSFQARVTDLLAFLESAPALWAQTPMVAAAATVGYAAAGLVGVSSTGVSFCALVAHGLTMGRSFRGLRLTNALALNSVPCRLMVYGIADDIAIATSVADSVLHFATPLPWWGDVLSRPFRRGESTSMRVISNSSLSDVTMSAATAAETVSIPVQPLAARDCAEKVSYIEFDRPFVSGQLSSVVLALIPNGAPSSTESQTITLTATATRNISANYPILATREQMTSSAVTITGTMWLEVTTSLRTDITRVVPNAGISAADSWNSAIMSMPEYVRKDNFTTARTLRLAITAQYAGKTYTYDTYYGDPAIDALFRVDLSLWRPSSATAYLAHRYSLVPEPVKRFSFRAHASDGSQLTIRATFNTVIHLIGEGGSDEGSDVGYLMPANWGLTANNYARNFGNDDYQDMVDSEMVLPGYTYAFATASNEGATADITQTGTISFVRNNVVYSAPYTYNSQRRIGIKDKTTGVYVQSGNSRTETATPYGDVHGFTQRLQFAGSNGSVLWANATLPLAALAGDVPYRASSAYNGTAQGIGTVAAAGLVGSVSISETYANAPIDPGLMMLVE